MIFVPALTFHQQVFGTTRFDSHLRHSVGGGSFLIISLFIEQLAFDLRRRWLYPDRFLRSCLLFFPCVEFLRALAFSVRSFGGKALYHTIWSWAFIVNGSWDTVRGMDVKADLARWISKVI